MKFAVNYSEPLLDLLKINPGLPVDYIKVPTIPFPECFQQFERGSVWRPLWPHPAQPGILALGHPEEEMRFNASVIREVMDWAHPPYLSTHLEARREYFLGITDDCRLESREAGVILDRLVESVNTLRQMTGLSVILENVPYYPWFYLLRIGSDPRFIKAVCQQSDCGFLLDLAHARCSAWYMGMPIEVYLKQLPLERVREIHLAGTIQREVGIFDMHCALTEDDYRIFEQTLEMTHPEVITLEYGGMPDRVYDHHAGCWENVHRNVPEELIAMISRIWSIIDRKQ